MPPKNLICIVIDRLHAGMIGAYGNSWIGTEHLDHLAAESFLFDQAYIDSPDLTDIYRAYWLGRLATEQSEIANGMSFPQLLHEGGIATTLLTDERAVSENPLANEFDNQIFLEPPNEDITAADISETQIARLFGTATEWLQSPREPFCLWIHARGMAGAWDAPLELRNRFAEEDDPEPPGFASVPNCWLRDKYDPDELLGMTHAYAGQVALLDLCVGALLDQFENSKLQANTQLTFLSARGFPLGEHRRVGACDEALYNELVQTLWLMRFPDGFGRLARSQALVLPADLPGTMLEWLGLDRQKLGAGGAISLLEIVGGERLVNRDRISLVSWHDRALRTQAWMLRKPIAGAAELYAKTGDRWEVNEVARLCPEIVTGLQAALAQSEHAGSVDSLPPLNPELVTEMD